MKYIIENINNYSEDKANEFYNNLPVTQKEKIDKILNKKRKKQSIVAQYLLEKLLKEYDIDYKKINIKYNNMGKPYIDNYDIYFSISHSDEYVIVAVSNTDIGIDIQKIIDINDKYINLYTTEEEKKYIKNKNDAFKIYCIKEAYFKLTQDSLNNIKNISFVNENKIISNINDISIKTIDNIDNYIIAYCKKN